MVLTPVFGLSIDFGEYGMHDWSNPEYFRNEKERDLAARQMKDSGYNTSVFTENVRPETAAMLCNY